MIAHEYLTYIILEKKKALTKKGYTKKEVDQYVDSIVEHVSTVVLVQHIEALPEIERGDLAAILQKESKTHEDSMRVLGYIQLSLEATEKIIQDLKMHFDSDYTEI